MTNVLEALKLAETALIKATLVYEANKTHPMTIQQAENALAAVAEAINIAAQEHREPTPDEYLELAKNADIVAAHEHCHLNEQDMKKAWVVEYGSQVYAKAWLDGFDSVQQAEQEPVAWMYTSKHTNDSTLEWYQVAENYYDDHIETPLYAAPIAAHWQKIHEQEMSMMSELCADRILEEREACAKVVETTHAQGLQSIREACAAVIRARGEK